MSRPQNSVCNLIRPQNQPIRAPKNKKDPKIKSNSKVKIEVSIENKSYSTTWVDPKTVLELYPDPKNSPLGPPKSWKFPPNIAQYGSKKSKIKIKSNSKELKES